MAVKKLYKDTEPDFIVELTLENGDVMTVEAYDAIYFGLCDAMPEGRYAYYTRHRECDMSLPCSVKRSLGLTVNFWGTIVTDRPINFGDNDELDINDINMI